jgi:alpha-glucosidase
MIHDERTWWRDAVVYQIYPRSFADSDGDGLGDIPGIISRLDYLQALGINALWLSPFYTSPLHDGGYDVADYRNVDPRLGTLGDIDELIAQAHARNIKIIIDIVPNHTSSEHPWFQEVLHSSPGSPAWDRYIIKEGKGTDREDPPNNWRSVFHGPGWSALPLPDGSPSGYWYLHLFDSTQPDLNWENPEVQAEFDDILRFWFDRGVDGFRIDVANGLVKATGLPDAVIPDTDPTQLDQELSLPMWDQDGVHDIYRRWRAVSEPYDPPRIFCAEAWVPNYERLSHYVRSDELHTTFNFEYLKAGWNAREIRTCIDNTITMHEKVGAAPTWVLSNHDVVRHASRLAPEGATQPHPRRARAATLFTLALPGSMYLYQGEELGLPEVHDLPDDARQDPIWFRSKGEFVGRDGCRVPIPWISQAPSFGFGPTKESWLPQPENWAIHAVDVQESDTTSHLAFYREALALRAVSPVMGDGAMQWVVSPDEDVLLLARTRAGMPTITAAINFSDRTVQLPASIGTDVLITSSDDAAVVTTDDESHVVIGPETAVWVQSEV